MYVKNFSKGRLPSFFKNNTCYFTDYILDSI